MISLSTHQFPKSAVWLNIDRPLAWDDLKGHVVLLDFWTYCCINCIHVLPDLKWLEHKYAKEPVVVIGIHSAKFNNENIAENVKAAIARYEIEHPVAVDFGREMWQKFGIRAWPSFVLVDPEGRIRELFSGEGIREPINSAIVYLLEEGKRKGTLAKKRVMISTDMVRQAHHVHGSTSSPCPSLDTLSGVPSLSRDLSKGVGGTLSFPGKLSIDPENHRLFVADSNHNRILQIFLEEPTRGKVTHIIGSGKIGKKDGSYHTAEFFRPQGVCFDAASKSIFVCDTENHLIRQIDLPAEKVVTVAGTGEQANWGAGGGPALKTSLNSPWDCVVVGDRLFVAMAGAHQLWVIELARVAGDAEDERETRRRQDPRRFGGLDSSVLPFTGSGAENIVDGPAQTAQLAQPSGIATDGTWLYFADSEVSAIRRAHIADGQVETMVGRGLFEFGHVDGPFDRALLQHCLGVAWWEEMLFVADTYNHAIRAVDLHNQKVASIIYRPEGKKVCMVGDKECEILPLFEPNDVKVLEPYLYIADTNNHLIRVFNLQTKELRDLEIVF